MIILLNKYEELNDLLKAEIVVVEGKRIVKVNVDQEDLNILIDIYIRDEK